MSIPVNLYVDRMSPTQPVRTADLTVAIDNRKAAYAEAATKIGLTSSEYAEFQQSLADGNAIYVRLPRHIDGMAGIHHRNHAVYALHDVVVPAGTMGWQVNLSDGAAVLIPQTCANLSMNRARVSARPGARRAVAALLPQPHHTQHLSSALLPTMPTPAAAPPAAPVAVAPTPVTFDVPAAPIAVAGSGAGTPIDAPVAGGTHLGALPIIGAAAIPIITFFGGGGGNHAGGAPIIAFPPAEAPPCSGGSNVLGVCQR